MKFNNGDFAYHREFGRLQIEFGISYENELGHNWDARWQYSTEIGIFEDHELMTDSEYVWWNELHRYFGLEVIS